MSTRFVPSLQDILYRLVGAATDESLKGISSNNPGRFPVVVRPETRAFLEAQASYLGGSIAGVAGAILDGVAMATQGREGGTGALRSVAERFNILIQEHQLSVPAAVEALSDLGFTLADFASVDALQLRMSSTVLRQIAERFEIDYDWLVGKSDVVINPIGPYWYQNTVSAGQQLNDAKLQWDDVELTLFIKKGADLTNVEDEQDWNNAPHFIPVLKRTKRLPGGEELAVYERWEEGRWSYERCREQIKIVVYFATRLGIYVNGRSLSPTDYERLLSGRALPVTIIHNNPSVVTWHPDDYVTPDSAVAKAPDEWLRIIADPNYNSILQRFEKLPVA